MTQDEFFATLYQLQTLSQEDIVAAGIPCSKDRYARFQDYPLEWLGLLPDYHKVLIFNLITKD